MMDKVKLHTCKNLKCKIKFKRARSLQEVCSYPCALELDKIRRAKKEAKEKKVINKERKAEKDKLKTLQEYKKDLENIVNEIVRTIDHGQTCISCGNIKKAFAGHYHSVGANGTLRFNLDNIHIQCFSCNGKKGGNIIKYSHGLQITYGKKYREYVEYELVNKYPVLKLSIEDIKEAIPKARLFLKDLKAYEEIHTPEERNTLRVRGNQRIGIYK